MHNEQGKKTPASSFDHYKHKSDRFLVTLIYNSCNLVAFSYLMSLKVNIFLYSFIFKGQLTNCRARGVPHGKKFLVPVALPLFVTSHHEKKFRYLSNLIHLKTHKRKFSLPSNLLNYMHVSQLSYTKFFSKVDNDRLIPTTKPRAEKKSTDPTNLPNPQNRKKQIDQKD